MSISTCANTKLLPILARIVLFGAFFSAGWGYIFTTVPITQEQRDVLEEHGVPVANQQHSEVVHISGASSSIHARRPGAT